MFGSLMFVLGMLFLDCLALELFGLGCLFLDYLALDCLALDVWPWNVSLRCCSWMFGPLLGCLALNSSSPLLVSRQTRV